MSDLGELHVVVDGQQRVYEAVPDQQGDVFSVRQAPDGPIDVLAGTVDDWWWIVDPEQLPDWARAQADKHPDRVRRP